MFMYIYSDIYIYMFICIYSCVCDFTHSMIYTCPSFVTTSCRPTPVCSVVAIADLLYTAESCIIAHTHTNTRKYAQLSQLLHYIYTRIYIISTLFLIHIIHDICNTYVYIYTYVFDMSMYYIKNRCICNTYVHVHTYVLYYI